MSAGRRRALDDALRCRLSSIEEEDAIDFLPMDEDHYDHSIALLPHIAPGKTGNAAHRIASGG